VGVTLWGTFCYQKLCDL